MRASRLSAIVFAALSSVMATVMVPVAAASPRAQETTQRVSYAGASDATTSNGEWVEIADATPCKHGKTFVSVGAAAGTFSRLRLDAVKGRPVVKTVRVDFANGKSRIYKVAATLAAGKKAKGSAYVDLGGAREIDQVVVVADHTARGAYAVHAEVSDGGVATR